MSDSQKEVLVPGWVERVARLESALAGLEKPDCPSCAVVQLDQQLLVSEQPAVPLHQPDHPGSHSGSTPGPAEVSEDQVAMGAGDVRVGGHSGLRVLLGPAAWVEDPELVSRSRYPGVCRCS